MKMIEIKKKKILQKNVIKREEIYWGSKKQLKGGRGEAWG